MSNSEQEDIKQHCQCGCETYHVKTTVDRKKVWAECVECGRPTSVMGDGMEKQREWNNEN